MKRKRKNSHHNIYITSTKNKSTKMEFLYKKTFLFVSLVIALLMLGSYRISYVPKITNENFEMKTKENVELKPCEKKYILLTTQQSGSTWACSQLHIQDNVACGESINDDILKDELMREYSFKDKIGKPTWDKYEKDLDDAFAKVCRTSSSPIIGFKLMYDQVPAEFILTENPFESPFAQYLQRNKISVIHLVREAKILRLASAYNSKKQKGTHARDEETAKAFRDAEKMPWDSSTIKKVLALEEASKKWNNFVHFLPNVPDFRVSYEYLVAETELQLAQILGFLYLPTLTYFPEVRLETTYLQLHEPACSDRVENYAEFARDKKFRSSETFAACYMLDIYTAN